MWHAWTYCLNMVNFIFFQSSKSGDFEAFIKQKSFTWAKLRFFFGLKWRKFKKNKTFGGQVKSLPMGPLLFIIFRNNLNGYGDFLTIGTYVGAASPKAGPKHHGRWVTHLQCLIGSSPLGVGASFTSKRLLNECRVDLVPHLWGTFPLWMLLVLEGTFQFSLTS